jgi:hypothetical protein
MKQIIWTLLVTIFRVGLDLAICWHNKYKATLRLNRTTLDVFFAGFTLCGVMILNTHSKTSRFYRALGIDDAGGFAPLFILFLVVIAIAIALMNVSGEKIITAIRQHPMNVSAKRRLYWLLGTSYGIGLTLLMTAVSFLTRG